MAFGTLPRDANLIPISSVYIPGVGLVALQGSTNSNTDGSTNTSTPANMNLTQIGSVAQVLDNTSTPRASIYGKVSAAGDTPVLLDSAGRVISVIQAVGGTSLAADQSN